MKNDGIPKKNLRYGVTFRGEYLTCSEVNEICEQGGRQLKTSAWIAVIASIATVFIPWVSIAITVYMIILFGYIGWTMVQYAIVHQKLMYFKKTHACAVDAAPDVIVDIKAVKQEKPVFHFLPHLPPLVISAVPVLLLIINPLEKSLQWVMLITFISLFACVVLIVWLAWYYSERTKNEAVYESSDLNAALTQVRKSQFCKLSVKMNYWMTVTIIATWMMTAMDNISGGWSIALLSLGCAGILYEAIRGEYHVRKVQQDLMKQQDADVQEDEDEYWYGGQFYCNPKNDHFLVNARTGINTTVNLGKRSGKIFMAVTILSLAFFLPFMCIWIIMEEFSPISIQVKNESLIVKHVFNTYELKEEDMVSVTLEDSLPENLRKSSGTAINNFYAGTFKARNIGTFEMCTYTDQGQFIYIEDTDGKNYIFSGNDAAETREIYENIMK